jgi:hypothetical protein
VSSFLKMLNGKFIPKREAVSIISEEESELFRHGVRPNCREHDHIDVATAQTWSTQTCPVDGEPIAVWVGPHYVTRRDLSEHSSASITASESEANIADVVVCQQKVAAWPNEHDDRATLA